VHVAAHATAQTIGDTHAFLNDCRRLHAAKDHARSSSMVKGNRITFSEVIDHAGVDALFTNTEVHLAGNTSFLPETSNRFFNPPASQHLAVYCNSIQFHSPSNRLLAHNQLLSEVFINTAAAQALSSDQRSSERRAEGLCSWKGKINHEFRKD
jgi:hypothetical protein